VKPISVKSVSVKSVSVKSVSVKSVSVKSVSVKLILAVQHAAACFRKIVRRSCLANGNYCRLPTFG
jgi:hypothetical protein